MAAPLAKAIQCACADDLVVLTRLSLIGIARLDQGVAGRAGVFPDRHRLVDCCRIGGCEPIPSRFMLPVVMMRRDDKTQAAFQFLAERPAFLAPNLAAHPTAL